MPITSGVYILTNVQQGNPVFLESPDDEVPLRGHYKPEDTCERWHWNVIDLKNGSYSIQNVEYKRYANCGSRAGLKAHVLGASGEQEWDIRAIGSDGAYTIGAIDTPNIWMLPTKGKDTPVELFNIPADRRCWWTFTNLETRASVVINKDPEDKHILIEDEYILFELKMLPILPFSPLKFDFIIIQQNSEDSISNTFATLDGLCGPLISLRRPQPDALLATIVEFRCPIPSTLFFHRVSGSLTFGTSRNLGHADLSWKGCGAQAFPQIRGLRADATKVAILRLNVTLIEQSGQAIITLINALAKQDIALILTPIQQTWADTFYESDIFQELEKISSEKRLFERKDQFSDYVSDYNEMVALPRLAEDRVLRDSIQPIIPCIVEALKNENDDTRSAAVAALPQLAAHADLRDVISQAMHKVTEVLKGNSCETEAVASALIKLAGCAELHDPIFQAVFKMIETLGGPSGRANLFERRANFSDDYVWTSLAWAAGIGYEAIVRILLAKEGTKIDARDLNGRIPLLLAAAKGHDGVVRLLLAHEGVNANSKSHGNIPLHIAARNGHDAVVQLLLAHEGVDVNSKAHGDTPLHIAAQNGHDAVVQLLLAHKRVDVNSKNGHRYGDTPLHIAAQKGHDAVVQLLLAHKHVDVNSKNKGDYGKTPLHIAAQNGHEAVVQLLLAHEGVDVNFKETNGDTPLHIAVRNRNEKLVRLLLEHEGVDVNSTSEFSLPRTWSRDSLRPRYDARPLHIAAHNDDDAVARLLLAKKGVDVNSKLTDGSTPLHIAVQFGRYEMVQLLLAQEGVDVNSKQADGATPLHIATARGWGYAIVQLLLDQEGVDVNDMNNDGQTPLKLATKTCNSEPVVRLLREKIKQMDNTAKEGTAKDSLLARWFRLPQASTSENASR